MNEGKTSERCMNSMKKSMGIFLLIILSASAPSFAARGDDILGLWNVQEKDAKIEIFRCGGKYCGRIVWVKEPNYPAGSPEGTPGTPRLDNHNPDAAKRSRPILGLQIVNDFILAEDGVWKDGTVYDPKSGNTYLGKITLVSPNQLE